MFKKYYLAYGSNLNLKQMKNRCFNARPIGQVILDNYRLVYKGLQNFRGYLTIEKCEGSKVPLGLFEVSFLDIKMLDRYEGYPDFYYKFYIPISIDDKIVYALIYIMNEEFDYHFPSINYINTCKEGYDDFGFDKSILDKALNDTLENVFKIRERIMKSKKLIKDKKND